MDDNSANEDARKAKIKEREAEIEKEISEIPDEHLEEALDQENERWARKGISPQTNIGLDPFHLTTQVLTILDVLEETGLVDKEKLNHKFQRIMLKRQVIMRESFERDMIRATLLQNLEQSRPKQSIILKPGDV